MNYMNKRNLGKLAIKAGYVLPVEVLRSARGYYIGTSTDDIYSVSRESEEYWQTKAEAQQALDAGNWTQRTEV